MKTGHFLTKDNQNLQSHISLQIVSSLAVDNLTAQIGDILPMPSGKWLHQLEGVILAHAD